MGTIDRLYPSSTAFEDGPQDGFVALSEISARVLAHARIIGGRDGPVMLTGESGTGKTRLCWEVHRASSRCAGPFIRKGCGEFDDGTLEATLFGHTDDAYTSARRERAGLLLEAHGGTLVLDDIDCLNPGMQSRLLRFLDDGGFYRLGDPGRLLRSNARIIVTTNVPDMEARVRAGAFRKDLWFRLRQWRLNLPPLRERPEDVKELAQRFLREAIESGDPEGQRQRPCPVFDEATLDLLTTLDWPGNIRDLRHAVENIALFGTPAGDVFDLAATARVLFSQDYGQMDPGLSIDSSLDLEQRILKALRLASGNIAMASRIVGCSRTTIYKLKRERGWQIP